MTQLLRLNLTELPASTGPLSTLEVMEVVVEVVVVVMVEVLLEGRGVGWCPHLPR